MEKKHQQTVVRILQHEESFEVRVSTFFYFDDDKSRTAVSGRPGQETAKKQAQEFARSVSKPSART